VVFRVRVSGWKLAPGKDTIKQEIEDLLDKTKLHETKMAKKSPMQSRDDSRFVLDYSQHDVE